ncbi:unnamed protein product [Caenorhabditis auriculariae]|uniref:Uncharacterized protein n=1 Tax=Caenorhabditis auriculariae TaxID=2777116 RepID=A0A8S1HMP3_9PELO|nr:unnamed protein product [Caenorhabditis auriculariae]
MSARDAMAAMLDELMGPKRNIELGKDTKVSFDDPKICPYYIVGFCPHDMFTNTKADIGACINVHDDNLRRMYTTSSERGKLGFERRLLRFLIELEDDNQRRIRKNKDKLKGIDDQGQKKFDEEKQKLQTDIDALEVEYKAAMKEAEKAGSAGLVEKCQEIVDRAEVIERQKNELRIRLEQIGHPTAMAPILEELNVKPMEVCETCGSMLIINDAAQRVEEHLTGKMHTGFQKIRTSIEELKEVVKKNDEEDDKRRESREGHRSSHRDRGDRKRSASKEKERSHKRSRSRDRGSDRGRHGSSRRESRDDDRKDRRDRDRDRRDRHDRHDRHDRGDRHRDSRR